MSGLRGWLRRFASQRTGIYAVVGMGVLALALAVGVVVARANPSAPAPANGTTLTSTVSINAHYTKTFHWTVDKSVTPDTWDLFRGDSGTSTYTIAVTKDGGTDAAWFDGQICVTNAGSADTQNLTISADLTMPPSTTVIATTNVDVSSEPVIPGAALPPYQTACYNYHLDVPSGSITPGASYKVTSHVTIMNHSGHLGVPFGPNTAASTTLPDSPTLINDTINVDDTNGQNFAFSDSGSQTYTKPFTCGDSRTYDNTATIRETGQHASASVQVNCHALQVSKTAATALTRTYSWQVAKRADQTDLTLERGQTYTVNYTVVVNTLGSVDSDWAVSGAITVSNPAPIDATINNVSDLISDGVGAAIVTDCAIDGTPVTLSGTLPAGKTLTCRYSHSLSNGDSHTNTATATLQNYSYDSNHAATATGTTNFTGSAPVVFDQNTTVTTVHGCVDVSDTYAEALGTVCVNDSPKTFTYSRTVGPYNACGAYTVDNTASFVATDDSDVTGSSSWTVTVHVPCNGCTLTIGFWKTHAGGVGNNPDLVSAKLPINLGSGGGKTVVVTTASQAITILGMNGDASNGINKLYAQLLGAKLNIAYGADPSAVNSTIAAADAFLATHNASDWSGLSKAQKTQVLSWMTTLDNYNNGLIGPGHCSQ